MQTIDTKQNRISDKENSLTETTNHLLFQTEWNITQRKAKNLSRMV